MWCYFFGPQLFLSSSIAYYKPARQANFGNVRHLYGPFFDGKPPSGLMCIVITTTLILFMILIIILTILMNTIKAVKCDSGGTLLKQLSVQLLR